MSVRPAFHQNDLYSDILIIDTEARELCVYLLMQYLSIGFVASQKFVILILLIMQIILCVVFFLAGRKYSKKRRLLIQIRVYNTYLGKKRMSAVTTSSAVSGNLVVPVVLWGQTAPSHRIKCLNVLPNNQVILTGTVDGQIGIWQKDKELKVIDIRRM